MPAYQTTAGLVTIWEKFLRTHLESQVGKAESVDSDSDLKTLPLDWADVEAHDDMLAQYLLDHPRRSMEAADEALLAIEASSRLPAKFRFRVTNPPLTSRIGWGEWRASRMGRLISLICRVKKVDEVRPKLESGTHRCELCGTVFRVLQGDYDLREPDTCPEEQGGCGRSADFTLLREESKFFNQQLVVLHDPDEERPDEVLTLLLWDDNVRTLREGDVAVVNGFLDSRRDPKRSKIPETSPFSFVMHAVSVERLTDDGPNAFWAAGLSAKQIERAKMVLRIVRSRTRESMHQYPDAEAVMKEAASCGITEAEARDTLQMLRERGYVYTPGEGRFAAV